jgi:hypothetical protein
MRKVTTNPVCILLRKSGALKYDHILASSSIRFIPACFLLPIQDGFLGFACLSSGLYSDPSWCGGLGGA